MTKFLPAEQRFLDEAVERLKQIRRTFPESTALQEAWNAGYQLSLQYDDRFVKAQPGNKQHDPHYRLREHRLANQRLVNDLVEGRWNGYDLDDKLAELDEEMGGHSVFYPYDGRLQSRQGRWEPALETNIKLTASQKSELDAFLPGLLQRWADDEGRPWTLQQILETLRQADWPGATLSDALRVLRAWLLDTAQIQRVGQDFWLPAEKLPAPITRTRLQVSPIRSMRAEDMQALDAQFAQATREPVEDRYKPLAPQSADPVIIGGEVTNMNAQWTTTLRTINLQEGFLAVPAAARAVYPPAAPGESHSTFLETVWHEDGDRLQLYLDRQQHLLHGHDLLRKIEWDHIPGDKLRIVWKPDVLLISLAGHDEQVEQEEARHSDPVYLKQLRGGLGEAYRDSIQRILTAAPDGLTFREIMEALAARLDHTAHRGGILALLSQGGFIRKNQRWFAAPDNTLARRALRAALIATMVPQSEDLLDHPLSPQESAHQKTQAIMHRLEEIDRLL